MNKITSLALAVLPAIVAPASAQEQKITASDYIATQMAILKGMNELMTIKGIEEAPGEVAVAIAQLTQYATALVNLKGQIDAGELAAAQGELEGDNEAQATGVTFVSSVNALAAKNFYNSNELAAAVQNFLAVLAKM